MFTYPQKQRIIDYLSIPAHWQNRFDTLFFDRAVRARFHGEVSHTNDDTLSIGSFFNALILTDALAAALDMDLQQLVNATKLMIARDYGVEPDLRALNRRNESVIRANAYDFVWFSDDNDRAPDKSAEQVAWTDTTDFDGFVIDTPRQFAVRLAKDGTEIRLSSDDKQSILSYGKVFRHAMEGTAPRVETITADAALSRIFQILGNGASTRDHNNRELIYTLVHSKDSAIIAHRLRAQARNGFGLKGYDFIIIAIDKDLSLMAMDSATLDHVRGARPSAVVPANTP